MNLLMTQTWGQSPYPQLCVSDYGGVLTLDNDFWRFIFQPPGSEKPHIMCEFQCSLWDVGQGYGVIAVTLCFMGASWTDPMTHVTRDCADEKNPLNQWRQIWGVCVSVWLKALNYCLFQAQFIGNISCQSLEQSKQWPEYFIFCLLPGKTPAGNLALVHFICLFKIQAWNYLFNVRKIWSLILCLAPHTITRLPSFVPSLYLGDFHSWPPWNIMVVSEDHIAPGWEMLL